MDMKKFHSIVMVASEKFYEAKHDLPIIMFAPLKNKSVMMCTKSFENNAEKQFAFDIYSGLLLLNECDFYSITGEVFYYQTSDMNNPIAPSEHPNRKEAIFTLTVDREQNNIPYIREIENDKFKTEWTPQEGDMFSGNLCELFTRCKFNPNVNSSEVINDFRNLKGLVENLSWYDEIPLENFLTGIYNG